MDKMNNTEQIVQHKTTTSPLDNNEGFAMLGILVAVTALTAGILATSEISKVIKNADITTKSTQTKQTMNMVRDYLINNARDIDSNGQPDVLKEDTGNALPASIPFNGSDMFGTAYKYCTWHIGPGNNGNAAYSQNNAAPPKTGMIAKLISAGADKTFQTTCDDANSLGDDIAYEVFNTSTTFVNNGWTAGAGNVFVTGMSDLVGIGTNTPPSKLTIYNSANNSDAQQQIRIGVAANQDYTIGRMTASGLLKFAGSEAANAGYLFEANGIERLKVTGTTGNIQMGAPGVDTGERLQVAGVIKTTDGTKIGKFGSDVITAGAIGIGSTTNHPLVLGANNTEVMRVGTNSTVQITKNNTAVSFADSTASALTIANTTGTQSSLSFTHGGTVNANIRVDTNGNMILNTRTGNLYLNYDSGTTPTIVTSGNNLTLPGTIGIGVAAGTYALNVAGTTNHSGAILMGGTQFTDVNRNVSANSVTSAYGYGVLDTRNTNDTPGAFGQAVTYQFKNNTVIGNGGNGTYSGVMTVTPWADDSGGGAHQIAYSDDGNIYRRYGTRAGGWNTWRRQIDSNDINGTINYIPRFTATTQIGNSSLYDDGTSIGLGTTSPGLTPSAGRRYFTLKGSSGSGVIQLTSSAANTTLPNLGNIEWHISDNSGSASTRAGYIVMNASGSTANNVGSYMAFATKYDGVSGGGVERMRLDNIGSLLLGTSTSPATPIKFVVDTGATNNLAQAWYGAGSNFSLRLQAQDGSIANAPAYRLFLDYLNNGAANSYIDFVRGSDGATGYLKFGTAGADRLIIDTKGRHKIGTSSTDDNQLLVNVNYGTSSNSASAIRANLNDGAGGAYMGGYNGEAYWGHNTEYMIGLGETARVSSTERMYMNNGNIAFYGDTGKTVGAVYTPTELMRINSTGLGIGGSPDSKLFVNGPGGSGLRIGYSGTSTNYIDADTQVFRTGSGTTTMYINSSGNIGIGGSPSLGRMEIIATTSAANTGLAVRNTNTDAGSLRMRFGAAATVQNSYLSDYYVNEASYLRFTRDNGSGASSMTIGTGTSWNPTDRLTVDANGNLLLGTSSTPSGGSIRQVINGTSRNGLQLTNNNNGGAAFVPMAGGGLYLYNHTGSVGSESYSSTPPLTVDASGYFGFGTTSPYAPLHVAKYNTWTANGWQRTAIFDAPGQSPAIQIGYGSGTRWGMGNSGGHLYMFTTTVDNTSVAASYKALFLSNGEVRLGGTDAVNSPILDLDSFGNARIGTLTPLSTGKLFIKDDSSYNSEWNSAGVVISNNTFGNPTLRIGTDVAANLSYLQSMHINKDWDASLVLQPVGGNALVGTPSDNGSGARLQVNGGISIAQPASGRNNSIIGSYDPSKLAQIWSMGAPYQIGSTGTAGNLYGLAYSYEPDYGGAGNNPGAVAGLGHQMQWRTGGATRVAIGEGGILTPYNIYAGGTISLANNSAFRSADSGGTQRRMALWSPSNAIYFGDIDNTNGSSVLLMARSNIYNYVNGTAVTSLDSTGLTINGGLSVTGSMSTSGNVTGGEVYTNGWFRNNTGGTGLYNQINGNHIYSESTNYWAMTTGAAVAGGLKFYSNSGSLRGYIYSDAGGFGLLHSSGGWGIRLTPTYTCLYNTVSLPNDTWIVSNEGVNRIWFGTNSSTILRASNTIWQNTSGTNLMTLDTSGNLGVTGNITATGTITGSKVYNAVYN